MRTSLRFSTAAAVVSLMLWAVACTLWYRSYRCLDQAAWLGADPFPKAGSANVGGSVASLPIRALVVSVNGGIGMAIPGWSRVLVTAPGNGRQWWWRGAGRSKPRAYPFFGTSSYRRPWHGFILTYRTNDDWVGGKPPANPPRQWICTVPYWFPFCATTILSVVCGRSWWKSRVRTARGFPVTA